MPELLRRLIETLRREAGLRESEGIVVAVSGGMDSMVLLDLLHRAAPVLEMRLVVAHGHHGLRPAEADGDQALVHEQAMARGLPFVCESLPVLSEAENSGESIEMAGRRLRHDFLARTALASGCRRIALAHHADDQVELILLRLLRGAGGEGLGGMTLCSPSPSASEIDLIRPLLSLPRDALTAYAQEQGLKWREDSSNQDIKFLRNRIRHGLLPLLQNEYQPEVRDILARSAAITAAEADFTRREGLRWLSSHPRVAFDSLHEAVQRAVIRQQLWKLGVVGNFHLVERLRVGQEPVSGPNHVLLVRTEAGILERREALPSQISDSLPLLVSDGGGGVAFGGAAFEWTVSRGNPGEPLGGRDSGWEWFDADRVGQRILLRHWGAGDRFQPLGLGRSARLQNLFVNRKVPAPRRRTLVVAVTDSGELFWVESLPPGENFKVTEWTRRRLGIRALRSSVRNETPSRERGC